MRGHIHRIAPHIFQRPVVAAVTADLRVAMELAADQLQRLAAILDAVAPGSARSPPARRSWPGRRAVCSCGGYLGRYARQRLRVSASAEPAGAVNRLSKYVVVERIARHGPGFVRAGLGLGSRGPGIVLADGRSNGPRTRRPPARPRPPACCTSGCPSLAARSGRSKSCRRSNRPNSATTSRAPESGNRFAATAAEQPDVPRLVGHDAGQIVVCQVAQHFGIAGLLRSILPCGSMAGTRWLFTFLRFLAPGSEPR